MLTADGELECKNKNKLSAKWGWNVRKNKFAAEGELECNKIISLQPRGSWNVRKKYKLQPRGS